MVSHHVACIDNLWNVVTVKVLGMQISRQNDKAFVVCGDFARCARTILWGGAVSPLEHLDDKLVCISLATRK